MAGVIPPTLTSNIGFGFGETTFSYYGPKVWHGMSFNHFHSGIDYWGPPGYPIWSAANGTVRYAGFGVPYIGAIGGNGVVIQHGPNMLSVYGHMQSIDVATGQQVVSGQNIGKMGSSGAANGVNHLHFEIWTTTPEWGHDVDDPNTFFAGGTNATFSLDTYDIPWIEPISGTTITLARCIRQGDGSYALPTSAKDVNAVYYDRIVVPQNGYEVVERSGNLYIVPNIPIDVTIEVRADYVT